MRNALESASTTSLLATLTDLEALGTPSMLSAGSQSLAELTDSGEKLTQDQLSVLLDKSSGKQLDVVRDAPSLENTTLNLQNLIKESTT